MSATADASGSEAALERVSDWETRTAARAKAMGDMARKVQQVRRTVDGERGLVRVLVDSEGHLLDIAFPSGLQSVHPDDLAAAVMAAIATATREVSEAVRATATKLSRESGLDTEGGSPFDAYAARLASLADRADAAAGVDSASATQTPGRRGGSRGVLGADPRHSRTVADGFRGDR